MRPDFWRGKRVLVTGHSGFKGSWLSLWLASLASEIAGYSAGAPGNPSLYELAGIEETMPSFCGDVRDLGSIERAFATHRPEIVIHMASQPLVRRSYRDPLGTFETNVLGTVNVLETVRRSPDTRVVVNVTTDKVYEDQKLGRGYREDESKGGHDPYSASKVCSELVTSAYRSSFFADAGAAVATARAGNVIGGGDWGEDRLVPDVLRAALERKPLAIRNPDAIRPWQHVLSPLSGYLTLAEALWASSGLAGAWNFGPAWHEARSVRWIVERFGELWGEPIEWHEAGPNQPPETDELRLDSTKARAQLGWTPAWDLERALRSVVEWARGYQSGDELRALTLRQIDAFQRDITTPATLQ